MKTKSASTRKGAGVRPNQCRFFVADDIRLEQGSKPSLLGFFADNVVVLPLPKTQGAPTRDKPIALSGLAFLISFPGAGTYNVEMEFRAPNAVSLIKSGEAKIASGGPVVNLVTRLQPFLVTAFGIHELIVRINKKSYTFRFEIRRGKEDPLATPRLRFQPPLPLGKKELGTKRAR